MDRDSRCKIGDAKALKLALLVQLVDSLECLFEGRRAIRGVEVPHVDGPMVSSIGVDSSSTEKEYRTRSVMPSAARRATSSNPNVELHETHASAKEGVNVYLPRVRDQLDPRNRRELLCHIVSVSA